MFSRTLRAYVIHGCMRVGRFSTVADQDSAPETSRRAEGRSPPDTKAGARSAPPIPAEMLPSFPEREEPSDSTGAPRSPLLIGGASPVSPCAPACVSASEGARHRKDSSRHAFRTDAAAIAAFIHGTSGAHPVVGTNAAAVVRASGSCGGCCGGWLQRHLCVAMLWHSKCARGEFVFAAYEAS